jgi:hypothetical protein
MNPGIDILYKNNKIKKDTENFHYADRGYGNIMRSTNILVNLI